MRLGSVPQLHHLEEGMAVGRLAFQLDGCHGKQEDLNCRSGAVPERT